MLIKKAEGGKVNNDFNLRRIELCFVPLLIIFPIIVSIFFIRDWFYRGFSSGISTYDGELIVAIIILAGNIIFNIPFLKPLIFLRRK